MLIILCQPQFLFIKIAAALFYSASLRGKEVARSAVDGVLQISYTLPDIYVSFTLWRHDLHCFIFHAIINCKLRGSKMPHFFIESKQIDNNKITISDKENYQHIARSLRARVGESLLLIDNKQIQYETTITEISKSEIVVEIDNYYPSKRFLDFQIYLAQSPLRSDAQSLVIEKATELGASGIFPVITDNCALNKSVIEKKIPKWNKIMYEASKQCERAIIPRCFDSTTIEELLNNNSFDKVIVFCERIADKTIRDSFKTNPIKKDEKVLVIIGPEGGFSQKEFDYFKEKNLEIK